MLDSLQNFDILITWLSQKWPAIIGAALAAYTVTNLFQGIFSFVSRSRGLAGIPTAPESNWLLGNAIALATNSPWEKMNEWVLAEPSGIIKVRALNTYLVIVGSPQGLKQVFQTKQRDYGKDVAFSYHNFLNILGAGPTSGLVTAEGEHWRRQRSLMGPTLRTDILDAVIGIGKRAADRLSQKLEAHRASGQVVDMEEEFRLLTLQVIGEAMLSLPPDECDMVSLTSLLCCSSQTSPLMTDTSCVSHKLLARYHITINCSTSDCAAAAHADCSIQRCIHDGYKKSI